MTFDGKHVHLTRAELAFGHLPPWAVCLYLLWKISESLDGILLFLQAHK